MKTWSWVVMIALLLGLPGVNYADQAGTQDPELAVMEEMVVTAGRVKEKKKEITANLTVIDSKEIQMSSALNLGDLLAEKAIGHIQKYPGDLTAVGLRGFRTETHGNDLRGHVLVLLNGRRAGTGNLAKIDTRNIERIEIIRGPAAVQYGSAAMGGILNVITRQGKGDPGLNVEGVLGGFGYEEGGAGISGNIKRFDFSGSMTTSTADDYDTAGGQRYLNSGYDRKTKASMNLGFEVVPGNRISVIYHGYDADHVGMPGYLSQNDLDDYSDKSYESYDIIYDGGTVDAPVSWEFRYFQGEDEDKTFDPVASNPDGWDLGLVYTRGTEQKGAQAQISTDFDYLMLTAGFDWVNYEMTSDPYAPQKSSYDNGAGFLIGKVKLMQKRLIVSGGLRYDTYKVELEEPAGRTEKDQNLTPGFGLAYLVSDSLKFRVNYGEAFVMPDAEQMSADYVIWGIRYVGNPNLGPEKSKTYEGGIDASAAGVNSSVTWFYTDFEDKIESVTGPGGIKTWENIGKAVVSGFEGEVNANIASWFDWDVDVQPYVNVVYLTEFKDEDTDEDLLYTSDLNASYGIRVSDRQGLAAYLNFAYVGRKNVNDWETSWAGTVVEQGGFTVANLGISKKIADSDRFGGLTLRGDIQNLFDKDYDHVKGYPMPGRRFFVGLKYAY